MNLGELIVPREALAASPHGFLERLAFQLNRCLGVPVMPAEAFVADDLKIRMSDNTPAAWGALFGAWSVRNWAHVERFLKQLEETPSERFRDRGVGRWGFDHHIVDRTE